jgi:hypothetical protein
MIELGIGSFLGLIFMGLLVMFFLHSKSQSEKPRSSMLLQDSLYAGLKVLTRDLQETSLLSVRTFPSAKFPKEPPGLSLESPRTIVGTPSQLIIGPYGRVQWQKYVYYTLRPSTKNPRLGELIRDEATLTDQPDPLDISRRIPVASATLPSLTKGTPSRRQVIFRNLALPGQTLVGGSVLDDQGGFRARVQGETVQLELIAQSDSNLSGKATVLRIPVQVKPWNF